MDETGGILHNILSYGPTADLDMAVEILAEADYELRKKINIVLSEEYTDEKHNDAVIASAEINKIIGIFKVFFDQWYENPKFQKDNKTLTTLASIFSGEMEYQSEYNKICYLIKNNLPDSVGTEKDIFKAPPPFKSQIFDD